MTFAFNPITGNLDLVGTGGGGGGSIFITPVGSSPNADGGSTTGSTLTLQPADGTFPGVITAGTQTIGGDKTWNGAQKFDAAIEAHITTNAATTGSNATIPLPAKTMLRLTNAGLNSIDMIAAGGEGRLLVLVNKTGSSYLINNETGATPANRILTGTGASVDVPADASVWVQYDTTSSRWVLIGSIGAVAALAPVGAAPNANAATIASGVLNLEPANATNPGVLTAIAQTIGGDKTFNGNAIFSGFPNWVETPYTSGGVDPVIIPVNPFIRFTNGTLVSFGNINPTGLGNNPLLILANLTGNPVTIKNDSTGTAGFRIITGTGADMIFANLQVLFVIRDLANSRWRVIGSSTASGITGTGTATQLTFWSGSSSVTSDADFSVDTTTNTLNLGQGADILELSTLSSDAIAAGSFTDSLLFTYPDTYTFAIVEYSIERSTNLRVGTLSIINNGSAINVVDNYQENGSTNINLASPGVTHTLSGGNVEIRATSTGGAAGTFKKSMRRWN